MAEGGGGGAGPDYSAIMSAQQSSQSMLGGGGQSVLAAITDVENFFNSNSDLEKIGIKNIADHIGQILGRHGLDDLKSVFDEKLKTLFGDINGVGQTLTFDASVKAGVQQAFTEAQMQGAFGELGSKGAGAH